jgi:dipeptidyl aminopeptidase/acylaminoacyl peptidase
MTISGSQYQPYGWDHWPDEPWFSYQFRRALGEAQVGGGTVSESFLAASRMDPLDRESWHREWRRIADASSERAQAAEDRGHVITARDCWLRATDQYRSAEFWLDPADPRRLETFTLCEDSFRNAGRHFRPPVEHVTIPYLDGKVLYAHLLKSPHGSDPQPLLIALGGLDSFKEEMLFMVGKAALDRGIACLFVDGPGQGATLRREGLTTRFDYEVPIAACIDWLSSRSDIDQARLALSGSSLGGYYSARAASFEHRLAAVVSHGGQWDLGEQWSHRDENHGLAMHIKWVFGADSMAAAWEKARAFRLAGAIEGVSCPYLIVHGGHDVLGVAQATTLYDYAKDHGVDVRLRVVDAEETGAEHCQHDNPTVGMEIIADWLCDRFGIDQSSLGAAT